MVIQMAPNHIDYFSYVRDQFNKDRFIWNGFLGRSAMSDETVMTMQELLSGVAGGMTGKFTFTKGRPGKSEWHLELKTTESSMLSRAEYDENNKRLIAVYRKDGQVYVYSGVPPIVFVGLLYAKSAGAYMRANVIGYFEYRRLSLIELLERA